MVDEGGVVEGVVVGVGGRRFYEIFFLHLFFYRNIMILIIRIMQ